MIGLSSGISPASGKPKPCRALRSEPRLRVARLFLRTRHRTAHRQLPAALIRSRKARRRKRPHHKRPHHNRVAGAHSRRAGPNKPPPLGCGALSSHRADDPLERHAIGNQALLHGGSVPGSVPACGLLDIGPRIGGRYGIEKVWVIRPREGPSDIGRAIFGHGKQLPACSVHPTVGHESEGRLQGESGQRRFGRIDLLSRNTRHRWRALRWRCQRYGSRRNRRTGGAGQWRARCFLTRRLRARVADVCRRSV